MEDIKKEKPLLYDRVASAFQRVINNTINVCDTKIPTESGSTQANDKIEMVTEVLSTISNYPLTTVTTKPVITTLIRHDTERPYRAMDALVCELLVSLKLYEVTDVELFTLTSELRTMTHNDLLPGVVLENYASQCFMSEDPNKKPLRSNVAYLAGIVILNMFANEGINMLAIMSKDA